MTNMKEDSMYLRRLQTINRNHQAIISIASPIVKKLKLSKHDTIAESLDSNDRIILQRVRMSPISQDGVVQ